MTFSKSLNLYDRGIFTKMELTSRLIEEVTPDNVEAFYKEVPRELIDAIFERIDRWGYPKDDDGWSKMRILRMGSWVGSAESIAEHIKTKDREEIARIRRGVETLRNHL